jgi:outer membrane lipoprotein-sorting protein
VRFLRTTSTSRLLALMLAVVVVGAGTAAIALAAGGGGGSTPPPKPLADAIHDALTAPRVEGVTARIKFTDHLVDSSAIPGATPLLSGASGRAWAGSDGRVRLELQSDSGDVQLISDGHSFLVYDGSSNTAYRGRFPQAAGHAGSGKHEGPPSVAEITKSLAQAQHELALSGATPTTVAGQPAYRVRVRPLHGGLVSGAALAWDAVRGVPLSLAVYARGNGSPVLALTAKSISYGAVPASTFAIVPPSGAKIVNLDLGSGMGAGSPKHSVRGLAAVQRAVPFRLAAPARLAGRARAHVKLIGSDHSGAALVTYGQGLDGLAVIEQQAHGKSSSIPGGAQLPSVAIGGVSGQELPTALGTAVRFTRNGVEYTVLGSQPSGVVLAAARAL